MAHSRSVSANTQQASSFGAWGTSPIPSTMRLGNPGLGSLKRGSVGSSWNVPRPKVGTSATLCPVPNTAAASAFEDLLRRTCGISTAARRDVVTSSPFSSTAQQDALVGLSPRGSSELPLSPAGSLIVGFNIGAEIGSGGFKEVLGHGDVASVTSSALASAKLPGGLPAGRAKAKGLLSKALDVPPPVLEAMSPMPSFTAQLDPLMQFSWFPDVDPRPLKDAQTKHAIFSSELVTTAYMIAARCYRGEMRKNGESLLQHCMETAFMVADLGLDAETVSAALLHEALRWGDDVMSQLEEFMPRSVVECVERVQTITEVSQLYRRSDSKVSDDGMTRMLIAMEDVGAVIIKLADRVHNMRTVAALPRDRQVALARETLDVYSVVANRLGVWYLKAELEDSAFAVLHPAEHGTLKEQLRERHDPVGLADTIDEVRSQLDTRGIKYEDISGRQKNLYSIWTKMQRDGKTLDEVLDVVALRVVVATKHDCYLALRSVGEIYRTVPNRFKDYIRVQRKANGYQSLHETVIGASGRPVEVQVRTHKMHYIAEYGFAAHWKYKEKLDGEDEWLDKQVQYKKWLTHYKLGVHDKKVRPIGSPPTDNSLKSLGFQYVDGARPEELHKVDDFLKLERFRLERPPPLATSVHVHMLDKLEVRTLPALLAVADLSRQLGVGCGSLEGQVLLLNGRLPASGAVLRSGDFVQVVSESAALGRSPPRSVPMPSSSPARELERLMALASYTGEPRAAATAAAAPVAAADVAQQDIEEEDLDEFMTVREVPRPQQADLDGLDLFMPGCPQPVSLLLSGGPVPPPGWVVSH